VPDRGRPPDDDPVLRAERDPARVLEAALVPQAE
jgi:hypothetical protein